MFKKLFFSMIVVFLVLGSTCLVLAQIKANAGADQTVHPGDEVTLDGSGSTGPDGAVLDYYWSKSTSCSAVTLVLPVRDQPVLKFTAPPIPSSCGDSFYVTFTLTLSLMPSVETDIVKITVEPLVNQPPVAEAGPDQIVFDRVVLEGSQSQDPDGENLVYLWEVDSDGKGAYVSLAAGSPVEVGAHLLEPYVGKIVSVRLTVTDPSGASDSDGMLLAVVGPVAAPEPEPVEPNAKISLHHFNISQFDRWDKKAAGFYGTLDMPEDLRDLGLNKGDVVDALVTIQLFDVPQEGESFIATGEAQLKVKKWRKTLYLEMMRHHHCK